MESRQGLGQDHRVRTERHDMKFVPVSYTHLDVYKRQLPYIVASLRVLANALSKELDPLDKEISKAVQWRMTTECGFKKQVERI